MAAKKWELSDEYVDTAPKWELSDEYVAAPVEQDQLPQKKSWADTGSDVAAKLVKGTASAGRGLVGLADFFIPGNVTGAVRKLDEAITPASFREATAKAMEVSPEQEADYAARSAAFKKGFIPGMAEAIKRPSTIGYDILESVPSIATGGIYGRTLSTATKMAPAVAGAAGEGFVGLGSAHSQVVDANKGTTPTNAQMLNVLSSGAGTMAFGVIGNKLSQKLGVTDIDTAMAGGRRGVSIDLLDGIAPKKGLFKRVAEGAVAEGVFEEAPQSAWEQMMINRATGKPFDEGLGEAIGTGLLAGGAMGAGMNVRSNASKTELLPDTESQAQDQEQEAPPPAGGLTPAPPTAPLETTPPAPPATEGGLTRPSAEQLAAEDAKRQEEVKAVEEEKQTRAATLDHYGADTVTSPDGTPIGTRFGGKIYNHTGDPESNPQLVAAINKTIAADLAVVTQTPEMQPIREKVLAAAKESGFIAAGAATPAKVDSLVKELNLTAETPPATAVQFIESQLATLEGKKSEATQVKREYFNALLTQFGGKPKEVQNAVQERSAAQEVPRAGTAGQVVTEGGEGVGQVEQGTQTAAPSEAKEVAISTNALDTFSASLPKQQKAVFDLVRQAAENNELDKFISADGTWQATEIGKALGISKQAVNATKALRAKLDSAAGMDVKAALAARTAAVRSTEMSDVDRLGLSPAMQVQGLEPTDVYGAEGAEPSMGTIETVGGSQGATSADVSGPLTAKARVVEQEARKIIREGGEPTAVKSTEASETAIAANQEQKVRDLAEAIRSGDLADAVYEWNQQAGRLPGVTAIPTDFTSMELNADGVDLLHAVVSAYQDVQLQIEAALDAGTRFTDPTGAYEYEFNRIVRERTAREAGAKRVVDGKPDGAQPALEAKPETGEVADESGVSPEKPVKVEVKKKKVLGPKLSETTGAENPISAESLTSRLKAMFRAAPLFDKIVTVYPTQADAMKDLAGAKLSTRHEVSLDPKRHHPGASVNIVEAPTRDQVLNLLSRSKSKRLRGLYNPATRQLFIWDAYDAQHRDVQHAKDFIGKGEEFDFIAIDASANTKGFEVLIDDPTVYTTTKIPYATQNIFSGEAKLSEKGHIAGFKTADGKIGLIAENIEDGQELGVFLHEVGVHLGMEKLIGKNNMRWLDSKILEWAELNDNSPESVAAKAAIARSKESTTDDNAEGRIAYMVEELVKAGVQPKSLVGKAEGWLYRLVGAMRTALLRLNLKWLGYSGQNLVDLAFGAANIELGNTGKPAQVSPERQGDLRLSEVAPRKAAELIAGAAGSKAVTDASHYLKIAATSLEMLHDTVTRVSKTLPSVTDWYKGIMAMKATRTEIKRRADVIAIMASKLSRTSYAKTNKFIERATTEQKWYRQPEWLSRKVVVDPGMAAEWAKLTKEEKDIADAVFKFGEDESNNMQKQFKALGISDVFTQIGKLEGPYAPLMRFGGYVAVLKSQALVDAERVAKDGTKADRDRVEALKRSTVNFVSKKFHTMGQAKAFTEANKKRFAFADAFTESERLDDKSSMGYQQLQKIMAAIDASTEAMPAGAKESLQKLVKDIYMTTVDQASARQSGQKRQGIAGADENMLNAFAIHARAHAAFVANVEHGPEISKAFYKMQQEAKSETGHRTGQDDFNLLARHYAEMTRYDPSPVQDAVMAGTTVWMLSTSLSYHVQNFSQGVMKSLPKLAADFGAGKYLEAWKHLIDGYMMMGSITEYGKNPDLSKIEDDGLRAALTYAAEHELLDVGIEGDLSHLGRFQTGYVMADGASAVAGRVLYLLRQVARTVESWNRISSGTAAYNMAIANGRTQAQAQSYVMDMLNSTQGDTSRTDAPLLLKKVPKVMAQYKRFQFMSAAMYTKATYAAFKGATAEEKGIGRRMLGFMLLHTSVAGGVLALPMMNLAAFVFGMFGGDDDPEDMDTVIRRNLGEGVVSDFLLDGAPKALLGIDMSAKLSDRNLFSIAPYTTFDFSSKAGMISAVAGVAGGPSLSQAGKIADGIGLMKRGELYKGTEKMLPKGLESAMQAFRMANDGVTLKNGDVIVKPEDLSAYALALSAFGMPSEQMREITRNQNVQYTVRKFYTDRTKELTQQYVAAAREGDSEEMAKIRVDWRLMQLSKDKVRYLFNDVPQELKKQPTANLATSVQSAKKRQRLEQRVAAE